jgi:hypothetical protein
LHHMIHNQASEKERKKSITFADHQLAPKHTTRCFSTKSSLSPHTHHFFPFFNFFPSPQHPASQNDTPAPTPLPQVPVPCIRLHTGSQLAAAGCVAAEQWVGNPACTLDYSRNYCVELGMVELVVGLVVVVAVSVAPRSSSMISFPCVCPRTRGICRRQVGGRGRAVCRLLIRAEFWRMRIVLLNCFRSPYYYWLTSTSVSLRLQIRLIALVLRSCCSRLQRWDSSLGCYIRCLSRRLRRIRKLRSSRPGGRSRQSLHCRQRSRVRGRGKRAGRRGS